LLPSARTAMPKTPLLKCDRIIAPLWAFGVSCTRGFRGAGNDRILKRRFCSGAAAQESGGKQNVNKPKSSSTVDPKEVAKFAALSQEWWNPSGPFAGLMALNEARVPFITTAVAHHCLTSKGEGSAVLEGLRLLDVGCGGGILAEALARLGGDVTGIDVTKENIDVAHAHMQLDPELQDRLRYEPQSMSLFAHSKFS
jgi:hypothetical protein